MALVEHAARVAWKDLRIELRSREIVYTMAFFGALLEHRIPLILVIVLGALGIAVIGSVFAATLLKVRSRDVLLPVILYPLLVPLFVAGTKCTAALLAEIPNFDAAWFWIQFLGI